MSEVVQKMSDGAKQNWITLLLVFIPLVGVGYTTVSKVEDLKLQQNNLVETVSAVKTDLKIAETVVSQLSKENEALSKSLQALETECRKIFKN